LAIAREFDGGQRHAYSENPLLDTHPDEEEGEADHDHDEGEGDDAGGAADEDEDDQFDEGTNDLTEEEEEIHQQSHRRTVDVVASRKNIDLLLKVSKII
jgi:hypothetical protein